MSRNHHPEQRRRKRRSRTPLEPRKLYIPVLSDELLGLREGFTQSLHQKDVLFIQYDPSLVEVAISRLGRLLLLQEWWHMPEPTEIDPVEEELLEQLKLLRKQLDEAKDKSKYSPVGIPDEWLRRCKDFFENHLENEIAATVELLLIKSLIFAVGVPAAASDLERLNRIATTLVREGLQTRGKGRPKDSGYFGSKPEFEERIRAAVKDLRSEGKKITQPAVAKRIGNHTSRQLREWLQRFHLKWDEVKSGGKID